MIEIESAMHDYFYTLPGTFIHNYEFCLKPNVLS